MDRFWQFLVGLGAMRLSIIGSVIAAIIGFFFYLIMKVSTPDYTLMFSSLDTSDAAAITQKLETSGIPYEVKGDGTQIYVPSDRVAKLRMEMALDGLPSGGVVGFELFDKLDALTATGPILDINYIRALEGSLTRSIRSIDGVVSARVHLVIPKKELFKTEQQPPSASIIIKMKGLNRLTNSQVRAIQHLVASAVPGLTSNKISIVDDRGNLLARGEDENGLGEALTAQQEIKVSEQNQIAHAIEALLEKTLGPGKVKAEVSLDLDFDRVTTSAENYNPNGQVIRSTSTVEGDENAHDGGPQNVTVQNALPNQNPQQGAGSSNQSKKKEETTNYEISKTSQTNIRSVGIIKRLSVAVLVDGTYKKATNGVVSYTPLSAAQIKQLTSLVKTTVGFDAKRGDKVEVVNLQFYTDNTDENTAGPDPWYKTLDLSKMIEVAVLGLLGILVMFMVVRPILMRALEGGKEAERELMDVTSAGMLGDGMGGVGQLSTDPANINSSENQTPAQRFESQLDSMINLSNVEGEIRASSIEKIGKIVDEHPDEAVSLLRSWMNEG